MTVADFLGALRRRWYLVLSGLLITGALGYGAMLNNPPTYTARGLVLLLPSQTALKTSPNPLLALDGLELPGRVLVAYYASADAQAQMKAAAPGAGIEVSIDDSTGGPVIAVDVDDPTPEGTLKALHYVVNSIGPNLARIQSQVGAPSDSAVSSTPLAVDSRAQTNNSVTIRMTVAAAGVGLVATILVVFAVDGLALRRRRRTAARIEADSELGAAEDAETPSLPGGDGSGATHRAHSGDSTLALRSAPPSRNEPLHAADDSALSVVPARRPAWSTQRR